MNIKYNKALWIVTILAIVMLIPFLGLTEFNTKGEPREAVVAYTMLEHGNWILPINNGGDIPYKPPFFHPVRTETVTENDTPATPTLTPASSGRSAAARDFHTLIRQQIR